MSARLWSMCTSRERLLAHLVRQRRQEVGRDASPCRTGANILRREGRGSCKGNSELQFEHGAGLHAHHRLGVLAPAVVDGCVGQHDSARRRDGKDQRSERLRPVIGQQAGDRTLAQCRACGNRRGLPGALAITDRHSCGARASQWCSSSGTSIWARRRQVATSAACMSTRSLGPRRALLVLLPPLAGQEVHVRHARRSHFETPRSGAPRSAAVTGLLRHQSVRCAV